MAGATDLLSRERQTVEAMIRLYCRGRHGNAEQLCGECAELLEYARERLRRCPFQEGKTTCAKCPVHCYRPEMRARIRAAMRYAGPRMLYRHPILALRHLLDGLRRKPVRRA
jgi:predicted amidophosphoribosyltransferase